MMTWREAIEAAMTALHKNYSVVASRQIKEYIQAETLRPLPLPPSVDAIISKTLEGLVLSKKAVKIEQGSWRLL